jgi:acyl dehydratase
MGRTFEDFPVGARFETGEREITESEIVAFARDWDPQDFHTDPAAAGRGPFGGLSASGFHTLLVAFRLTIDTGAWVGASLGSPGMEEIRWLLPVRPGDRLKVAATVAAARPSRSKPDRGIVTFDHVVTRQDGATVMTYRSHVFLKRRGA